MFTQTYDLLTVQAGNSQERPYQFGGTLANQKVEISQKHPWVAKIAGTAARLRKGHELKLLGLEFTVDPEARKLDCRATGPLGRLLNKDLDKLRSRLARQGRPIALREGGLVYSLYQPPVPSLRLINSLSMFMMRGRRPYRPTACTLQITARCQLNCYHCSAARYTTPDRAELSTEEWLSVIRQAEAIGVTNIVFTGGEPLLRPDIFDLIVAVNRDRAQPMMFTNGLLLTEKNVARLADAGLFSLMVSLDDPRPEEHNRLRRSPHLFERATEGLQRVLETDILVGISTYAGPQDVREGRVEQMIEFGREVGVHEITIFDVVPTGKLLSLEQDFLLTPEDKRKLIELERHYNQQEGYPHITTQALVNGPEGSGCFAGCTQFYMTAYGDVDPCDFTPLTFGNIRDEPLFDIWTRMLSHPAYSDRCNHCRMQDPDFRRQYIDPIPDDILLPWPAFEELLDRPHGPQAIRSVETAAEPFASGAEAPPMAQPFEIPEMSAHA